MGFRSSSDARCTRIGGHRPLPNRSEYTASSTCEQSQRETTVPLKRLSTWLILRHSCSHDQQKRLPILDTERKYSREPGALLGRPSMAKRPAVYHHNLIKIASFCSVAVEVASAILTKLERIERLRYRRLTRTKRNGKDQCVRGKECSTSMRLQQEELAL